MKVLVVRYFSTLLLAFLLVWLPGCQSYQDQKAKLQDTPERGTINISADESFKPVIDEQVKVYESNHPGTKILVQYKPEAECLKDLLVDSVRMIIATRSFSEAEKNFIVDSMKISPQRMIVARDAVAVIVNPLAEDSLFTMQEIREILTGKFGKKFIPVFDGVKATSTVRFIVDSVLKNDSLTPDAMAARNSEGVIDYVAENPQTIGFIGVSWIGNKEDSSQQSFLQKVTIANIQSTDNPEGYIKPYQANIYVRRYPMVRDLVYLLKEKHQGLGNGFANFLNADRGQLIFRRAYLLPAKMPFWIRPTTLNQ